VKKLIFIAFGALLAAGAASAERPLIGDPVNGAKLVKKARVDGNWINQYSDKQCLVGLRKGKAGFPKVKSKNLLDRWDALAFLKSRNSELEDLFPDADRALITWGELDEHAEKRLKDQAKLKLGKGDKKRTLFALFKLGEGEVADLRRVKEKDHKQRDTLKPGAKVGYVVFMKLAGVRGGKHELALAVDNDVVIRAVEIRAPDGSLPKDLNQAAARFVGRGARGKYQPLKAGGAGKAVREIQAALSSAYLRAMENVYMYEVRERDYFAFDDG
jgi:hypothetical protein